MFELNVENVYLILLVISTVVSVVFAVKKHKDMKKSELLMLEVLPIVMSTLPEVEKALGKKEISFEEFEGAAVDLILKAVLESEKVPAQVKAFLTQEMVARLAQPLLKPLYDKLAKNKKVAAGEPIDG